MSDEQRAGSDEGDDKLPAADGDALDSAPGSASAPAPDSSAGAARDDSAARDEVESAAPSAPLLPSTPTYQPSYVFLAVVSVVSLGADLASKAWATRSLGETRSVEVLANHVRFTLAHNRGGAWGMLQDENSAIRLPFFLLISAAAIVFILSLYRKLAPGQTALKWGLPLVLGGALGNLVDRIRYGHVIDFIDVRADFIAWFNHTFLGSSTDRWPTFNIADIAIVAGVALMAIDMFTSRKKNGTRPASAKTSLGTEGKTEALPVDTAKSDAS